MPKITISSKFFTKSFLSFYGQSILRPNLGRSADIPNVPPRTSMSARLNIFCMILVRFYCYAPKRKMISLSFAPQESMNPDKQGRTARGLSDC